MTSALDELVEALPDGAVVIDVDRADGYRRDSADLVETATPQAVVLARRTDDVVVTMEWAPAAQVRLKEAFDRLGRLNPGRTL